MSAQIIDFELVTKVIEAEVYEIGADNRAPLFTVVDMVEVLQYKLIADRDQSTNHVIAIKIGCLKNVPRNNDRCLA